MKRKRLAAALAAAPVALLVGSPVFSVSAAGAGAAAKSACNAPSSDKVLTVAGGIALVKKCSSQSLAAPAVAWWHWMGNYGSLYDVANVANSAGIGPGALIAEPLSSGPVPSFMYY